MAKIYCFLKKGEFAKNEPKWDSISYMCLDNTLKYRTLQNAVPQESRIILGGGTGIRKFFHEGNQRDRSGNIKVPDSLVHKSP